jgi:hypothetical protein
VVGEPIGEEVGEEVAQTSAPVVGQTVAQLIAQAGGQTLTSTPPEETSGRRAVGIVSAHPSQGSLSTGSAVSLPNVDGQAVSPLPTEEVIRERAGLRLIGRINPVESGRTYEQKVDHIANELENTKKDVGMAMTAIQSQFHLIQTHGRGLQNLPALNLARVVPSFFNNPSFRYAENSNEEEDLIAANGRPSPLSVEVLSTPAETPDSSDVPPLDAPRSPRGPRPQAPPKEAAPPASISGSSSSIILHMGTPSAHGRRTSPTGKVEVETVHRVQTSVDADTVFARVKRELDIDGMQKKFERAHSDHLEAMAAFDRKIDRDYVERLFDKFRLMIVALGDRIKELASSSAIYATRDDVEMLAAVLKRIADDVRPASALKKSGPGCLFCGRPRTALTGQVSARTAAMAGNAPVRSVVAEANRGVLVYGETEAFQRGSLPSLNTKFSEAGD